MISGASARILQILKELGAGGAPTDQEAGAPPEEEEPVVAEEDLASPEAKKSRAKYGAFPRQRPQ